MTTLWRVSDFIDLNGEGGLRASGRWHIEGKRIVYLADCPASALLERIVHMTDMYDEAFLPRFYQLLKIAVPEELAIKPLNPLVPIGWKEDFEFTQQSGDSWLASLESPLARVPSAVAPCTWNFLLNPEHQDAKRVEIAEVIRERFDNRLFRFGSH